LFNRALAATNRIGKRFHARFLRGTSPWNALTLVLLLGAYAALSAVLFRLPSGAKALALTGFVALLAVAALLYYGWRQSAMTLQLQSETERADAEKKLSGRLQEAFLQQRLPALPNLGFSATYLSAAAAEHVGGDWYDAFMLPHGRILFSIGDVAGHGIEAAVTMSRARQAMITAALQEGDPGSILARANTILLLQDSRFATAICGYIQPATREVTYATAGHPPAILVSPGGSARLLQYDGLPLGVDTEATYPSFRFTAEPQSMLILYTDGLVEYDHDLIEGERRMLDAARKIARRRAANPAAEMQDEIFARYEPLDDVAILTILFADAEQRHGEQRSVEFSGSRTAFIEGQAARTKE